MYSWQVAARKVSHAGNALGRTNDARCCRGVCVSLPPMFSAGAFEEEEVRSAPQKGAACLHSDSTVNMQDRVQSSLHL